MTATRPIRDTQQWPTYWFAELERAVEVGDYERAAEAQRQLRRLNVHVRYGIPPAVTCPTSKVEVSGAR